jgi:hypothetical protein
MTFDPGKSMQEKVILEWLIHHPEVVVEGYKGHKGFDRWSQLKNTNSPFKLVNLDAKEQAELENEEFVDQLVGRVMLEGGKQAIGLDRLRWLLSALGRPYRSNRYAGDPTKEKRFLRKSLKNYIRSGMEQAKEVAHQLENNRFENKKADYYVKELVRLDVFKYRNNLYEYEGMPVAATTSGIVKLWLDNPIAKEEHLAALEEAQELEIASK